MTEHADWPALPYAEWAPTRKTLHMVTQMLGKAKLALAPPQPQWLHSRLFLDARGFTTGPVPCAARVVTMGVDLFESELWVAASDGRRAPQRRLLGRRRQRPSAGLLRLPGAATAGLRDRADRPPLRQLGRGDG